MGLGGRPLRSGPRLSRVTNLPPAGSWSTRAGTAPARTQKHIVVRMAAITEAASRSTQSQGSEVRSSSSPPFIPYCCTKPLTYRPWRPGSRGFCWGGVHIGVQKPERAPDDRSSTHCRRFPCAISPSIATPSGSNFGFPSDCVSVTGARPRLSANRRPRGRQTTQSAPRRVMADPRLVQRRRRGVRLRFRCAT